jgi:hypothetical protein
MHTSGWEDGRRRWCKEERDPDPHLCTQRWGNYLRGGYVLSSFLKNPPLIPLYERGRLEYTLTLPSPIEGEG